VAADLYEQDFYAWTQQQAEALRTHFAGYNRLDVEHLAEEVEGLGKSELHPRIRQQVETELDTLYDRARRAAARSLHQREPDFVRRLPKTCPYPSDAIWNRDVLAEAGIDLSDGPDEVQKKRGRKRGA
jgi:Domain of unknown function DUF29